MAQETFMEQSELVMLTYSGTICPFCGTGSGVTKIAPRESRCSICSAQGLRVSRSAWSWQTRESRRLEVLATAGGGQAGAARGDDTPKPDPQYQGPERRRGQDRRRGRKDVGGIVQVPVFDPRTHHGPERRRNPRRHADTGGGRKARR